MSWHHLFIFGLGVFVGTSIGLCIYGLLDIVKERKQHKNKEDWETAQYMMEGR